MVAVWHVWLKRCMRGWLARIPHLLCKFAFLLFLTEFWWYFLVGTLWQFPLWLMAWKAIEHVPQFWFDFRREFWKVVTTVPYSTLIKKFVLLTIHKELLILSRLFRDYGISHAPVSELIESRMRSHPTERSQLLHIFFRSASSFPQG